MFLRPGSVEIKLVVYGGHDAMASGCNKTAEDRSVAILAVQLSFCDVRNAPPSEEGCVAEWPVIVEMLAEEYNDNKPPTRSRVRVYE